ncbi:hypothetical protein STHU_46330 [Allostella humosa]|nr:hypothetical protein STHU_46330 [Stella humosa]
MRSTGTPAAAVIIGAHTAIALDRNEIETWIEKVAPSAPTQLFWDMGTRGRPRRPGPVEWKGPIP